MDILEKYSSALSSEIAQERMYDGEKVKGLIKTYFKMAFKDMMLDYVSDIDKQYIAIVTEMANHKIGSQKYVELGFKLSALKPLKATANRIHNNEKRMDRCAELEAELTKQSNERDVFRTLLKKYAPEAYQKAIDSLIIGEEVVI